MSPMLLGMRPAEARCWHSEEVHDGLTLHFSSLLMPSCHGKNAAAGTGFYAVQPSSIASQLAFAQEGQAAHNFSQQFESILLNEK